MSKVAAKPDSASSASALKRLPGTALHHQIFLVLRDRILNGQYEPGGLMPTEDELARLFSVSRVTVRAALATLGREGLVERRQGVGTFVAATVRPSQLHTPVSDLIAQITDIGRKTSVDLLEFDFVKAPAHVQAIFKCDETEVFQRAVRLRKAAAQPIFYITTYVPQRIAKNFSREQLEALTLYRLLAESGVSIVSGSQVVSAVLADPVVAPLLNQSVGDALIQVRRRYLDGHGNLIGYVEILASPTTFEVHMSLDTRDLVDPRP